MNESPRIHESPADFGEALAEVESILADSSLPPRRALVGFDGFIDTFIEMEDPASMAEFGPQVEQAAGISTSFPVRHEGDRFGGNGPLLACGLRALLGASSHLTYYGGLGRQEPLPVFAEALDGWVDRIHSFADPAHSDCLQFRDGKIMLSDLRNCAEVTWEALLARVGEGTLDEDLATTDCIAAVNWGKLPHAGRIWEQLAHRLETLGRAGDRIPFFMDLAEFSFRAEEDKRGLQDTLRTIAARSTAILSLNLKEAWQLGEVAGARGVGERERPAVARLADDLRAWSAVDRLVIHPNDGALVSEAAGTVSLPGPLSRDPVRSVGAGDNFGAGILAGALHGLHGEALLLLGVLASGTFVRTGEFPQPEAVTRVLRRWREGTLGDRLED